MSDHTFELHASDLIAGRYVVVVEGDGHGSFQLPAELPTDLVLVERADLTLVLDEDAWPLEDAEAARARLREAVGR